VIISMLLSHSASLLYNLYVGKRHYVPSLFEILHHS